MHCHCSCHSYSIENISFRSHLHGTHAFKLVGPIILLPSITLLIRKFFFTPCTNKPCLAPSNAKCLLLNHLIQARHVCHKDFGFDQCEHNILFLPSSKAQLALASTKLYSFPFPPHNFFLDNAFHIWEGSSRLYTKNLMPFEKHWQIALVTLSCILFPLHIFLAIEFRSLQ